MEEKQFDDRTKRDLSLDDFLKAVYADVKRREPALCKLYPDNFEERFNEEKNHLIEFYNDGDTVHSCSSYIGFLI